MVLSAVEGFGVATRVNEVDATVAPERSSGLRR